MSLRDQIIKRFRTNYLLGKDGFINSQSIQDYAHINLTRKDGTQYKHETIGRLLRKLAEEKILEAEIKDGKHVASVSYKYIPSEQEIISNRMKLR